jgi:hypothetical protein
VRCSLAPGGILPQPLTLHRWGPSRGLGRARQLCPGRAALRAEPCCPSLGLGSPPATPTKRAVRSPELPLVSKLPAPSRMLPGASPLFTLYPYYVSPLRGGPYSTTRCRGHAHAMPNASRKRGVVALTVVDTNGLALLTPAILTCTVQLTHSRMASLEY